MERPYDGIATVIDTFQGVKVLVPAKRNMFVVLFLSAWLCGWLMGEVFALTSLVSGITKGIAGVELFLLFWLVGWTVGGGFAIRIWFWQVKGKEVISFMPGSITINKEGLLFYKSKTFDSNEIKKIRVVEEETGFWGNNNRQIIYEGGTIRFDYGLKTIKFGIGLSSAEANSILETLKSRNLLSDHNF